MAFEKNYIALTQQEYPNAYFKVVELFISYIQNIATITVFGYKDEIAADATAQPIIQQDYRIADQDFFKTFTDAQKQDPVAASYGYLATLPDYDKATPV